ncbi:hypothetical protein ALC56_08922 [Trachymyrmex septentrionalis]|uniref:Uncharacterized protein n=1 Tax=Trachymyrmex septentrionalis TaxID=34720 RepID=A0A195F9S4_9HYME|nr:hypothetical protein ALC56_08922 [Trachymyrmex septentrionalis]
MSLAQVYKENVLADQSILVKNPCLLSIKWVWSNASTETPKIYLDIQHEKYRVFVKRVAMNNIHENASDQ